MRWRTKNIRFYGPAQRQRISFSINHPVRNSGGLIMFYLDGSLDAYYAVTEVEP
jgi:hypothetical protein